MENLTHSQTIGELVKALVAASKNFKPVIKDKINPYFKSRYADLSSVLDATTDALLAEGLVIVQAPLVNESKAGVTTMLMHTSGEWMRGDLLLPVSKWDAQGSGSGITYARRYAVQGFLHVSAEEDDDGNEASDKGQQAKAAMMPKPPQKTAMPKPPSKTAKPVEEKPFRNRFWGAARGAGKSDDMIRDYVGWLGYERTEDIPLDRQDEALEWAANQ